MHATLAALEDRERAAFTVTGASHYTSIGRSKIYQFMRAGELPFKQLGKRRLLRKEDLDRLISPTP